MDPNAGGCGAPVGFPGPSGSHIDYSGFSGGDASSGGGTGDEASSSGFSASSSGFSAASSGCGGNDGVGLPAGREALLRSYQNRLKGDVRSMLENFQEIIIRAKPDPNRSAEQDDFEIQVRASNMLRAGQSLLQLVGDIKQFIVLNDFKSINESIVVNAYLARVEESEIDQKLIQLQDDMDKHLYEMEDEYYTSEHK